MRILAIETTEKIGSIALLDGDRVQQRQRLADDQRSAQSLAPGIDCLLRTEKWTPEDVELVAVSVGPGSFTGLRVGVTWAKTFAFAVGAEVLGISTLEAVAATAPGNPSAIEAAINAQRQQVFACRFERNAAGDLSGAGPFEVLDDQVWIERLRDSTVVTGPALTRLGNQLPAGLQVVDSACWAPCAATVGQLAWRDYQVGRRDDCVSLAPVYGRKSYAEEKHR